MIEFGKLPGTQEMGKKRERERAQEREILNLNSIPLDTYLNSDRTSLLCQSNILIELLFPDTEPRSAIDIEGIFYI